MRAIIIGAGVGGLLAAAAAAGRADEIVILERAKLPTSAVRRAGVAQGRQLHNLLSAGCESVETLLPGFMAQVCAEGGVAANVSLDTEVWEFGRWAPQRDLGLTLVSASRPAMEHALRTLVLRLPEVIMHDDARVEEVLIDAGRVRGVLARSEDGLVTTHDGDIVIDASAAGFSTAKLCAGLGLAPAQVERAEVGQWYVSALFDRPPPWRGRDRFWMVFPTAPQSRGGLISPLEGGKWYASMSGRGGDPPPDSLDAFLAYAKSLDHPRLSELLDDARLVEGGSEGAFHLYRRPVALWRRYRPEELPLGFLPIGDSIAALNPLMGQGMSVAAIQAVALREALSAGVGAAMHEAHARYLDLAHETVRRAWDLQALFGPDGPGPVAAGRDATDYFTGIASLLDERPDLHRAYVDVWHLRTHWSALTASWVVDAVEGAPPSRPGQEPRWQPN